MDPILSLNFFGVDDPKDLPAPEPLRVSVTPVMMTAFDRAAGLDAFHHGEDPVAKFAETFAHPVRFDPKRLEKRAGDDDARREAYVAYIKERLAEGRSVESLCEGLDAAEAADVRTIADA